MKFEKILDKALQVISENSLRSMNTEDIYTIWNKEPSTIAWIWDKNTNTFLKGGRHHFNLAYKLAKKNNLTATESEIEEIAEEILDSGAVRGYYFPFRKMVAIYPIRIDNKYIKPNASIFNDAINKLGIKDNIDGIMIEDEYYTETSN